jgi:hypothetical protein
MKQTLLNRAYAWAVSRVATKACEIAHGAFPPVVRIETTNACNSACVMCPHKSMTRPVGVMEQALYEKIVRECAQNNVKAVHLHNFGEPLLDKHFAQRVAFAKGLGVRKVKFFTNASLLNDERIDALLDAGPDEIKASIDSNSKERFEAIRVGLRYDSVTDSIRRLVAARNKRGLKLPVVKLNFVLREDNRHERGPFVREWKGIADRICFDYQHNWSRGGDESNGGEVLHACLRIWNTFTVLWDGRAALCCLDYDGEEILGDLTSQTIREVWHNPRLGRIRQMHSGRDFSSIPICRVCSKIR